MTRRVQQSLPLDDYTQEQARSGVHFRELGEIDTRQGSVIICDDFSADYLERKKS